MCEGFYNFFSFECNLLLKKENKNKREKEREWKRERKKLKSLLILDFCNEVSA